MFAARLEALRQRLDEAGFDLAVVTDDDAV